MVEKIPSAVLPFLHSLLYILLGKQQTPTVNECPEYAFASKLQEMAEKDVYWQTPTWFNSQGSEEIINSYSPGNHHNSSVLNKMKTLIFKEKNNTILFCFSTSRTGPYNGGAYQVFYRITNQENNFAQCSFNFYVSCQYAFTLLFFTELFSINSLTDPCKTCGKPFFLNGR